MRKLCKLNVPVFQGKEYTDKVLYFADPYLTSRHKTLEEEFRRTIYEPCEVLGIRFTNYECTDVNPIYPDHKHYSILFFDYGGMSAGNSMLDCLSKLLIKTAIEHPNRLYCMESVMTMWAVRDAMKEFDNPPANVYLDIEDLCNTFFLKYRGV